MVFMGDWVSRVWSRWMREIFVMSCLRVFAMSVVVSPGCWCVGRRSAGHGRQDVDEVPVQGSRSYEVLPGRPTLWHRLRADRSKRRQTPERGRQSSCGSCPRRLFPVSTSSILCKRSWLWWSEVGVDAVGVGQ